MGDGTWPTQSWIAFQRAVKPWNKYILNYFVFIEFCFKNSLILTPSRHQSPIALLIILAELHRTIFKKKYFQSISQKHNFYGLIDKFNYCTYD